MEIRYFNLFIGLLFLTLALILFFRRSPNKRPNTFLGVFFLLITFYSGFIVFHFHSIHTRNMSQLSYYLPLDVLLLVMMSPCFYFYVLQLLHRPLKFIHPAMLLHAVPILLAMVFNVLFYFQPVDERVDWLIRNFHEGSPEMTVINVALYLQILFYFIITLRALGTINRWSVRMFQHILKSGLAWVQLFLLANTVFLLGSLPVYFWINNQDTALWIGCAALYLDFFVLFIMAILKIDILDAKVNKGKKVLHPMDPEKVSAEWQTLINYMADSKPYLDENCSVATLAVSLKLKDHQLSRLLNKHGKIIFADFINEYRLKEAIIYLEDQSKNRKNIDMIHIECGFGSRTTFFRAFKKVYGISPKAYRKKHDATYNKL